MDGESEASTQSLNAIPTTISGNGIPSQCKICHATFPSRSRLFVHLRSDHEEHEFATAQNVSKSSSAASLNDAIQRQTASNLARLALTSPDLEAYYGIQSSRFQGEGEGEGEGEGGGGIMTVKQWSDALKAYRTALPLAFRINSHSFQQDTVQQLLLDNLFESVPTGAISPVPSVPNVYVAITPRRFWSEHARKKLADAQEVGACHRQEVVSALPALLLGIEPHHAVLDLCAAPGSKTLQMLDLMHNTDDNNKNNNSNNSSPSGILVANDPTRSRLLQLTRRSRRQARTPLITSASDGRHFPTLRKTKGYKLKFDRVLCDAPCSGDGTLRKISGKEWNEWSLRESMSLHKLQVRLLVRALKAVKRGGRVLYSTCSLNPIEDEAVIVEAIRHCTSDTDAYRILPLPNVIDGAEEKWDSLAGAVKWVVPDSKFSADNPIVYESFQDIPAERREGKGVPVASMFSPRTRKCKGAGTCSCHDGSQPAINDCLNEELATRLEAKLPNTARILPQHLNSGGFFCGLIERLEAQYYPVCLDPSNSQLTSSASIHHAKIYHPVQTARQVRDIIRTSCADDTSDANCRHIYEGVPSLSAAQAWLRKHGAYVEGVSDVVCAVPPVEPPKRSVDIIDKTSVRCGISDDQAAASLEESPKTPMYAPTLKKPHPSLTAEFCSFYGLSTDGNPPQRTDTFPVENMVIIGGGADAEKVTSCVEVDSIQADDHDGADRKRRMKHLQLCLVSPALSCVHSGGAKFTPIESGLGICFVPVVRDSAARDSADPAGSECVSYRPEEKGKRRSVGRYALLDEAVEIVARCATNRVVALSRGQVATLLTSSFLHVQEDDGEEKEYNEDTSMNNYGVKDWEARWGRHRLVDVGQWENGGAIAVHMCSSSDGDLKTMFLSCVLCDDSDGMGRGLKLLSDIRLADSLRRVIEGH